jgi:hypothetical protein
MAVRCQLLIDRLNKEVESFAVVKKEGGMPNRQLRYVPHSLSSVSVN